MSGGGCECIERIYYRRQSAAGLCGLCQKGCPWNRKRRPSSYHVRETESCDKGDGRSGAGHPEGRKRKICCQRKPKHQDQWRKYEPILAKAAAEQENVTVLNHVNITDYKTENKKVTGAVGFSVNEDIFYDIDAKAVLCATGGAAGLYRPNNPGFSRHKMWYPPFNTGAGYAMGLLSGAEMTTFEMRFIALRCKDTIAPTGTIAQGVGARQVNAHGDIYETKYGLTTSQRVYGTVMENREGNGPCYLRTEGISKEQEQDLYKAYLNMAPSQTLKWMEAGKGPSEENVEIEAQSHIL